MSYCSTRCCFRILVPLLLLACSLGSPRQLAADDELEFRPRRLMTPRPAITSPPVIDAGDVTTQVNDNELVLGVVVEGEARAYPINMLTGPSREIINDTLGGAAIAATW